MSPVRKLANMTAVEAAPKSKMVSVHYANTPMQYTVIFKGCKTDNFRMKNCDNYP